MHHKQKTLFPCFPDCSTGNDIIGICDKYIKSYPQSKPFVKVNKQKLEDEANPFQAVQFFHAFIKKHVLIVLTPGLEKFSFSSGQVHYTGITSV